MDLTPNFTLSNGIYSVMKFHSGEIQVTVDIASHSTTITGSILSSDNLMELLQLVEALRFYGCHTLTLIMPYCAFSRQDRRCNYGESFSLKVFTTLINYCSFESVTTYDNHSETSTALLNNCVNVPVSNIISTLAVHSYNYLISPDAGSNKKVFDCANKFNVPMIRADKCRDTKSGRILSTDVYATPEQLNNATVLIIDDICAGGRTFIELAKSLKAIQPNVIIHLYVTHGFFTNGLAEIQQSGISQFITTDSVYFSNSSAVRVINL